MIFFILLKIFHSIRNVQKGVCYKKVTYTLSRMYRKVIFHKYKKAQECISALGCLQGLKELIGFLLMQLFYFTWAINWTSIQLTL